MIKLFTLTFVLVVFFSINSFSQARNIYPTWVVPGQPNTPPIEGTTVNVDGVGRVGIGTWVANPPLNINNTEDLFHIHGLLPKVNVLDCDMYREAALRISLENTFGEFQTISMPPPQGNLCLSSIDGPQFISKNPIYGQLSMQSATTNVSTNPNIKYSNFAKRFDFVLSTPAPQYYVHPFIEQPVGSGQYVVTNFNTKNPNLPYNFDIIITSKNPLGALRFGTTPLNTPENTIADIERMTILNNGNVGIGTMDPIFSASTPQTILPIKSPLQVGNLSIQPTSFGPNGTWGSIAYNNFWDPVAKKGKRLENGPVSGIAFEPWHGVTSPNDGTSHGNSADGSVYLFSHPNGVANTAYPSGSAFTLRPQQLFLNVWNHGSTLNPPADVYSVLFNYNFPTWNSTTSSFKDDGTFYIRDKVYIGTESLAAGVHPPFFPGGSYKLAVKGSILAQELVIDARAITWPDFVFDPGYNLQPLDELEKQLVSQRHLPGIPSAKDVEEKGLAIGDLQSKLLQKIEELTLYVIQLKKENDILSKRIGQIELSK